jgi:hypothetical protein
VTSQFWKFITYAPLPKAHSSPNIFPPFIDVRFDELRIPGQGGRDSEIDPVSIPKFIRSRFRDEVGQGFRF